MTIMTMDVGFLTIMAMDAGSCHSGKFNMMTIGPLLLMMIKIMIIMTMDVRFLTIMAMDDGSHHSGKFNILIFFFDFENVNNYITVGENDF